MNKRQYVSALALAVIILIPGCAHIRSALTYEDPLTAVENNNLGVAYEREGKYDLAVREYKRAIEKDGEFTVAMINLANVYFKTDRMQRAKKYYVKALETDPSNLVARNNLANLYIKAENDYEYAMELLTEIEIPVQQLPAYYLDTLGHLYQSLGDTDRAIEKYKLACTQLTEDDELEKILDEKLKELQGGGCTSGHSG